VVETGWVKLIAEFGLVGATTYFVFLFACVARTSQPIVLRLSLMAMTLLNGILDPWVHGLVLSLVIWAPEHRGISSALQVSASRGKERSRLAFSGTAQARRGGASFSRFANLPLRPGTGSS
jgi:hypothetical protein